MIWSGKVRKWLVRWSRIKNYKGEVVKGIRYI
jgi:hypothetical protein